MPSRPVTSWIVPLKGHAFDLEDLPIYLDGFSETVIKPDDRYFLRFSTSFAGETSERVGELAAEFLALLNGIATVLMHSFRPVELERGEIFGLDANDEVAVTAIQVDSVEMRCKAGHATIAINGVAQPDARIGSMNALVSEARNNQPKAEALTLVGRSSPSWSELYLVLELVEANVGRRMFTDGWITKAEASKFARTANSYTALGTAARHGKDRGSPPPAPMEHQSAVKLMRSLVLGWLRDGQT